MSRTNWRAAGRQPRASSNPRIDALEAKAKAGLFAEVDSGASSQVADLTKDIAEHESTAATLASARDDELPR